MYNALSTPDDLLHAYIDNEIEQELEQQLFTMLAADGELRARLRQMRGVRDEARRFGAVAAPPSALTSAVFERLGYAQLPQSHPSRMAGAALLLRSAWAPAVAAVVTFLTATVIFGLHDTPSLNPSASRQRDAYAVSTPSKNTTESDSPVKFGPADAASSTQAAPGPSLAGAHDAQEAALTDLRSESSGSTPIPPSGIISANTPEMITAGASDPAIAGASDPIAAGTSDPIAADASDPIAAGTSDPIAAGASDPATAESPVREIPVTVSDDVLAAQQAAGQISGSSIASTDESSQLTNGETGSIPAAAIPSHVLAQQGIAAPDIIDTRQYFPTLSAGPGDRFISVELRGVSATSFPEVTIGSRSDPWMENMAIGVYLGSERNDFGVEYGQEPFSQHYSGVENGKYVRYEQNMISSWVLGGYRHRFAPWRAFGSIEPYVATGIGATMEAWPLARAGMGIMYMPDRRVRFQLGFEGTLLAFPYQDKWFTSKRVGFTYGISVLI